LDLGASAAGDATPVASSRVTLQVVDTGRVDLLPRLQARSGTLGAPETFELSLVNRSIDADRFSITVQSESEPLTAPSGPLELAAGERRTLQVTLTARAGATTGAEERTTILARSVDHPDRSQHAELLLSWNEENPRMDAGTAAPDSARDPGGCSCGLGRRESSTTPFGLATLVVWLLLGRRARPGSRKAGR
jgi:hypothetical protein